MKKSRIMEFKNFCLAAALLTTGAAFTACSSNDDIISETQQPANPTGKYTLTINASKGGTQTRALSLDGKTLNVKWAATDQVAVYNADWTSTLGTLTAAASETGSTKLTGDLTSAPSVGDNLKLLFPRATWDYTGQTGVLLSDDNSIEKKYDYALAEVEVATVEDNKITTTDIADFESQQAIVKFTLKDKTGADLPVTSLTISTRGKKLVQSRSYRNAGWTPSGCEDYTDTEKLNYLYLEFPTAEDEIELFNEDDEDWNPLTLNFVLDNSFGTNGSKVVDGKYIYRLKSANAPAGAIKIRANGMGFYIAHNVSFTNGAYYTFENENSVSMTTPERIIGMLSTYGPLTVEPAQATNTLTVALRNELDEADTYVLTATDGTNTYYYAKSGVSFEKGKYYEITVKMSDEYPTAAAATSADKGNLICTDGHIHVYGVEDGCEKERVALILYVGSDTDDANHTHGLALALTNENNNYIYYKDAILAIDNKNTSSRAVKDLTWVLPSRSQWETILNELGVEPTKQNAALKTALVNVGGDFDISGIPEYWSSTLVEDQQSYPGDRYVVHFFVQDGPQWWGEYAGPDYDYNMNFARACLPF